MKKEIKKNSRKKLNRKIVDKEEKKTQIKSKEKD